jgi:hypothetical protein
MFLCEARHISGVGEAKGSQEGLPVCYLNHSNRPVRTRMPRGVGGTQLMMAAPNPDVAVTET